MAEEVDAERQAFMDELGMTYVELEEAAADQEKALRRRKTSAQRLTLAMAARRRRPRGASSRPTPSAIKLKTSSSTTQSQAVLHEGLPQLLEYVC